MNNKTCDSCYFASVVNGKCIKEHKQELNEEMGVYINPCKLCNDYNKSSVSAWGKNRPVHTN